MLPRRLIPAACLLASISCSSAPKTVRIKTPRAPVASPTGVKAAIERHVRAAQEIRNAVDAGEGDFEARQLRERLVADPGNLETRLRLATRYQELDMPELAIEHYRLAAGRFPAEAAPQIGLARALHRIGRTPEAAAHLESFLSAYAEAPVEAFSWAGILRDSLGHHHVAEQHHRAALGRASQAAYLRNNLGQNLALQDRAPEAAVEFRAALDLEPSNRPARNNLAVALVADPAEAARVLEDGGANDPGTAHSNLAAILIEQGRYAEARKELNLALGYKPDHLAALGNLALVSDLDGKPAQMMLPKQLGAAVAAANRPAGRGAWAKVGRAIGRVFMVSEDRPPEQAASANPAGARKKTAKAGRVNASRPRNSE
jgi:tetratricopeptide (TPR) repeat protein